MQLVVDGICKRAANGEVFQVDIAGHVTCHNLHNLWWKNFKPDEESGGINRTTTLDVCTNNCLRAVSHTLENFKIKPSTSLTFVNYLLCLR
jgi:hypothetical protein